MHYTCSILENSVISPYDLIYDMVSGTVADATKMLPCKTDNKELTCGPELPGRCSTAIGRLWLCGSLLLSPEALNWIVISFAYHLRSIYRDQLC